MFENKGLSLILASASKVRASLLEGTGLSFAIQPADIDEGAIRRVLEVSGEDLDPGDVAELLARSKAEYISAKNKNALIIGADQILSFEDKIYEKPATMDEAKANLFKFRGKTHTLHSAITLVKNGERIWCYTDSAVLTMRDFSAEFLGQYCAIAGADILSSVGAYKLESHGVHLFEDIKGDYFTILGFPLLPLLAFLRQEKMILG